VGKSEEKRPIGRRRRRWVDKFKVDMGWSGVKWIGLAVVESSCELGNEPSGSIKCWESTEWLHNLWPLEWFTAPRA
jgi:hypothetical protein